VAKLGSKKGAFKVVKMKCHADDGDVLETAAETLGVAYSSKNVRMVEEDADENMIIEEKVRADDASEAAELVKRLFKKFGVKGTVSVK